MIGNLSGLRAVVFLWRFGPLLCDARAICGTSSPRVTSLSSLYEGQSSCVEESDGDAGTGDVATRRRGDVGARGRADAFLPFV